MPSEPESTSPSLPKELERYSRQILFEGIGVEGQRRLCSSRVLLIGCGALGTVLANTLVRAGVGYLRICDRDYIELNNLQRQVLFDEEDLAANLPKAVAAAAKLRKINSEVTVEAVVEDVNASNIERLALGADLILDGTDNFETRFLINDLAVKTSRPWVYGAVVGATGLSMTIIPHDTPCLRCVFEEAPPPELSPTCDTAGVLGTVVNLVAALQATEAIKLLIGRTEDINRCLVHVDLWQTRFLNMKMGAAREKGDCPCCKRGEFPFLNGERGSVTTTLCGRDAVQVSRRDKGTIDLAALAAKLAPAATGAVRQNEFLLRVSLDGYDMTVFTDGRAIVKGTDDPDKARSLVAKYLGS